MALRTVRRIDHPLVGWLAISCATIVGLGGVESGLAAQTVIAGETGCVGCTLNLEHVASIGSSEDEATVLWNSRLAVNSEGALFIAPVPQGGVAVYSSTGAHLTTVRLPDSISPPLGNRIILAIDQGDSLHIVDNTHRRYFVVGPSHELSRSISLPASLGDLLLEPDGQIVAQASVTSVARVGEPLHRIAPTGAILESFGRNASEVFRIDRPENQSRRIAHAPDGGVWSARFNRYELLRIDAHGRPVGQIVRRVSWFPPWEGSTPGAFVSEPPPPRLTGLSSTSEGQLVVFIMVPDADWSAPAEAEEAVTAATAGRHFDTIVEILDPTSGKLVASLRYDDWLRPTVDGSLAYSVSETSSGNARMDIWRIETRRAHSPLDEEESR